MRSLLLLLIAAALVPFPAQAAPAQATVLQREVRLMMDAFGWPNMIGIAIARGEPQRMATIIAGGANGPRVACMNAQYTPERLLAVIESAYLQAYADPATVAAITTYLRAQGMQKLLAKVAARSKEIGAAAAGKENAAGPLAGLSAEERQVFADFARSAAGQSYLKNRARVTAAQHAGMRALARDIIAQCTRQYP